MTDLTTIAPLLDEQAIELPSWAFGNSGTRFKVFAQPGVPRDPYEKIADAAQVHAHTGLAPTVALHIPWDRVDVYAALRRHADEQTKLHVCVDLEDLDLCTADPAGLAISGFHKRHPQARERPLHIPRVYRARDAARLVDQWTDGATIVGVVPRFDTECLTDMLARHGLTPPQP